ncbi:cilia- and flagella-associated protein 418 [Astyanax mexicanus]|uniref:cilia- and flagella-associated protein 418 n=1 Tax=Astyanax mexicanus TaxID=7994 RepID=UPI0020CB0E5C|nr:cilia- and flagella-associated protein 418 [Astyanax mexicanus]
MADNLDDLLDEVEEKFCRNASVSARPAREIKLKPENLRVRRSEESLSSPVRKHEAYGDDIEAALQEILDNDDDDDQTGSSDIPATVRSHAKDSCPQTASKKCCPVFLGGSLVTSGVGTSISQRACDQLRCTACDFGIAMFNDHEWDSSCDYLFFRNNMPDRTKLRAKLKRRQGARAYACQCSWYSANSLSELRHNPQLKWVCGQHRA